MSRTTTLAILIILVLAVLGGAYYLMQKSQEKPVVFETESPFISDIIKKAVATGSVVPRKEIEIKPQVSGLINKLYVEAGNVVKKGDLIATVQIVPNMVNLNNAENRLRRARIALENTRKDFERNQALVKEGVIAEATFQQFEVAYRNAQEELNAAQDNLELIRKGSTQRSGRSANTNVRSTISGMVLDVPVEEGNSVIEANTFNDGTTIAIVANMDEMIFEGQVDEAEVGKLREGMKLLLTIAALDEHQFEANLEHIAPKGVEENGAIQFEIRAALKKQDNFFVRAGYSANADIVLDQRDSVLVIPESLLQFDGDSPYVEVAVGPQEFKRINLKTGLSDGINIEIVDGLSLDSPIKNPTPVEL